MADLSEEIRLSLNADELLRTLEEVHERALEEEEHVEEVKKGSFKSMDSVLGMVHAGWLATQGVVRAAGGSIQTVFRTVIGTALGAIATLTPLLTADWTLGLSTGNVVKIAQATMGLASIGIALGALAAAQQQEQAFSNQLRGANMALHGVQSIIGMINFT